MSLLDRMKSESEVVRWRGRHPVVLSLCANRNQRDAYFFGLVLGAVVDDKHIDKSEEKLLDRVGCALGYSECAIRDIITKVLAIDESERLALLEEVTGALRGTVLDKYFVAEFSYIWVSHGGNNEVLNEWRDQLWQRLDSRFDQKVFDALDRITTNGWTEDLSDLECLAAGLSTDFLGYLFDEKLGGFLRVLENARHKDADLKRVAAEDAMRKQIEAKARAKSMAEVFYNVARKLAKGPIRGRNDIGVFGTVLIRIEDLENIKNQLCDYASIDSVAAIDVIARKHIEQIACILKNAETNPGFFGGSIGGMRRFRIKSERELLVWIVACLVAATDCITSKSCSALNALLSGAMSGAEKVALVDDERDYWNNHVKPVLQKIFKEKD